MWRHRTSQPTQTVSSCRVRLELSTQCKIIEKKKYIKFFFSFKYMLNNIAKEMWIFHDFFWHRANKLQQTYVSAFSSSTRRYWEGSYYDQKIPLYPRWRPKAEMGQLLFGEARGTDFGQTTRLVCVLLHRTQKCYLFLDFPQFGLNSVLRPINTVYSVYVLLEANKKTFYLLNLFVCFSDVYVGRRLTLLATLRREVTISKYSSS